MPCKSVHVSCILMNYIRDFRVQVGSLAPVEPLVPKEIKDLKAFKVVEEGLVPQVPMARKEKKEKMDHPGLLVLTGGRETRVMP